MKLKKICSIIAAGAVLVCQLVPFSSAASDTIAHDASRNVQEEGVGNPFNYGERNTPADANSPLAGSRRKSGSSIPIAA